MSKRLDYAIAASVAASACLLPNAARVNLGVAASLYGLHCGIKRHADTLRGLFGTHVVDLVHLTTCCAGACAFDRVDFSGASFVSWPAYCISVAFTGARYSFYATTAMTSVLMVMHARYMPAVAVLTHQMQRVIDQIERMDGTQNTAERQPGNMTEQQLEALMPLRCAAIPAPDTDRAPDDTLVFCAICHETFRDKELHRVLPCTHAFHAACIDPWLLQRAATCPLCRACVFISP